MAKILYLGTEGSNDPTRASLPFVMAKGAVEAGHDPVIMLAGEATYLLKDDVARTTQGVGWPTIAEQWQELGGKATVYVWGVCGKARGVTDADLARLNAQWSSPKRVAELTLEADRVVSF